MERILEMARKKTVVKSKDTRRRSTDEFKSEAVQMMLDGLSAPSVMKRRGLPNVNMLYRWKQERLTQRGPVASFRQMPHKRTNNRLEDLDGVYVVGGGTHPGSGLPVIDESARITSRLIAEDPGPVSSQASRLQRSACAR